MSDQQHSSATPPALEVHELTKRYGSFRAVDGLSFTVPRGKIVGLLGPNGAGKTTTIQMLVGITLPDRGTISYFGKDLHRHREACLQRINFSSSYNNLQGGLRSAKTWWCSRACIGSRTRRERFASWPNISASTS